MAELKPFRGNYYLWKYIPSIPAAVIFLLLFLSITLAHTWRLYKFKRWFCLPLVIGGYMELIGYIVRIVAHNKTERLMPFAIQNVYILLAPVLFAATIYMALNRLIRSLEAEPYSVIPVRWLGKTFVLGDVLTLFIQSGGSSLMFIQNLAGIGNGVIIGGLALQVVNFGLFVGVAMTFQRRFQHARHQSIVHSEKPWRANLHVLYAVSALIMIRSTFRLVEYAEGQDGYLLGHEWTLYVFDSVPMWMVLTILFIRYPNYYGGAGPEAIKNSDHNLEILKQPRVQSDRQA